MKKRILAMLLSALLVMNISACVYAPENEIDETIEDTTFPESTAEGSKITTESEENADIKPPRKSPEFFNGVQGNSNATYTFNQNGEFSVYISDWDEDHLVTSLSDMEIVAAKYRIAAIGVNNEHAFLVLNRYYENKITVVSFEKGATSETVVNLDADEAVYKIAGSFISENIGYLFAFKEKSGYHARGDSKLSSLFKTEDGGNTWNPINVQRVPSISLSEDIIFAKMADEYVGVISGRYWADDYNFCQRTLLTTNGGRTWGYISTLPKINSLYSPEIIDFTKCEEYYVLTVRHIISENSYEYAKYKSLDLNVWTHID